MGDRWTFVNVLPRSGLIHTVHHGKRTKEEAEQFVQTIKRHSDGDAPLFLSDGWKPYQDVLESTYSHTEPVPYAGRGRPKRPIRVVDTNLKYAQVIKHKQGGRLVHIEKRVIWGTEEEIVDIIRTEQRGSTINTSYVESRNGNYRKDNKRLARRSACQSKAVTLHDAHIDLLTGIYNFVDANLGCPNQLGSVNRFLDSRGQRRLSSAWWRSIFKASASSRAPEMEAREFFITI